MTLDEYQQSIRQFAIYPEANTGSFEEINYLVLGLVSEAGELAGKWKKLIRDGALDKDAFWAEIGDCIWYISQLANAEGTTVESLAQRNYAKLAKRKETNTLKGSGDERESLVATN